MTDHDTDRLCARCWETDDTSPYDVEDELLPVHLCAPCAAEYERCPVCWEVLAAELEDFERVTLHRPTQWEPGEEGYRCHRCAQKGKRAVSL